MKPLRIIVVMVEPPLPFGNAAARWYYVLLRELMARGHSVTAFATCSKLGEIDEARKLFPTPQYDLRLFPHPERAGLLAKWETFRRPFSFMFSQTLKVDLKTELERGFDILHLEQLWSGWLGAEHRNKALVNIHHFTSIDLAEYSPGSFRERFGNRLMFSTENKLLRSYTHFRACSPRLVESILKENPRAHISVIPVGIDASVYEYVPAEKRCIKPPVLLLTGSMQWFPTFSAAERLLNSLWPKIKARVPDLKLEIVGWQARSVLKSYLSYPDVEILENVPSTRPYFEHASAMIYAPKRGSGMKIKTLEALGYGIPVITTSEGAEGLPAQDGVHMHIADDDTGLIDRAVSVLTSIDLQERLRVAGRKLLEEHCGPEKTVTQLEQMYQEILKSTEVQA